MSDSGLKTTKRELKMEFRKIFDTIPEQFTVTWTLASKKNHFS